MSESSSAGEAGGWFLYVIETAAGALYTGITTDVERRLREHRGGKRGARALRGKGPLKLVHYETVGSRSDALKLEAWLKKQTVINKHAWLAARRDSAVLYPKELSAASSWGAGSG